MRQLSFLHCAVVGLLIGASCCTHASELELKKGNFGFEGYLYPQDGDSSQHNGNFGITSEIEFVSEITPNSQLKLTPFVRLDPFDSNRTSFDFREAGIEYINGPWQLYGGMGKVSWSTTEAPNIIPFQTVDILNQRDLAGDPTGQEKLGAAMLEASYQGNTVRTQFYVLPWFRPRPFPSRTARENPLDGVVNMNSHDTFINSSEETRLGFAFRAESVTPQINAAFIQYQGYAPQPITIPDFTTGQSTNLYYLVDMSGITVQATLGRLLIKAETAYFDTRISKDKSAAVPNSYVSSVIGTEYSFIRFAGESDISALVEWLRDTRGNGPAGSPFSDAIFLGARWVANDANDTQIVGGIVKTLNRNDLVFQVQYESRLYDSYWLQLGARAYHVEKNSMLAAFANDEVVYTKLRYYF